MKNKFLIYIAALLVFVSGCNEDMKKETVLKVLETRCDISSDGGTGVITVETNAALDAGSNKEWCTVNVSGKQVNVTVAANNELTGRTAVVTLTAGDKTAKVPITQNGVIHTILLNPTSLAFKRFETGTKNVTINTFFPDWDFECDALWLTLAKEGNTLRVTVDELNDDTSPRTAAITITSGYLSPVTLQVTQAASGFTVFDSADAVYWGDYYGTGTANFELYLFNDSDPVHGLYIECFSTKGTGLTLDAGTYVYQMTGSALTFIDAGYGDLDEFEFDIKFEEGTFEVALEEVESEESVYTITVNFTGVDGVEYGYMFTGTMEFYDMDGDSNEPLYFTDIQESAYTATGTPQVKFQDGGINASEWEGEVVPVEDESGQYIAITNFADEDITIFADFRDGRFILDTEYPVWENETHIAYLELFLYYNEGIYDVDPGWWDGTVQYDKATRTINFSRSITFSDIGRQNLGVGVYAYQKSNGADAGLMTNIYTDVRITLTSAAPVPGSKSSNRTKIRNKSKTGLNIRLFGRKGLPEPKKINM